ncbi:MAG: CYTH domain-containing protein [Selenomonadaceae bacterium]|nr:CYTH domain-containing protein [Selenomonadaceae bacterium]
MALEIERKFLVDAEKIPAQILSGGVKISQGYLCVEPSRTVRVRTKGERGFLTIKSANVGIVRQEFEYEIPLDDAQEILKLCGDRILEKVRYEIEYAGKIWEVDVFGGKFAGLILAEVELSNADEKIILPDWVGAEVSDDPRYYNVNLIFGN